MEDPLYLVDKALDDYKMHKYKIALTKVNAALAVSPNLDVALHTKALILGKLGRYVEAADLYQRMLDLC